MDWYYPVLAETSATGDAGRGWPDHRYDASSPRTGWGPRVSDRPWIPLAETCECAMAHLAVGRDRSGHGAVHLGQRLRTSEDRYWTGIVLPDQVHFPGECRPTPRPHHPGCDALVEFRRPAACSLRPDESFLSSSRTRLRMMSSNRPPPPLALRLRPVCRRAIAAAPRRRSHAADAPPRSAPRRGSGSSVRRRSPPSRRRGARVRRSATSSVDPTRGIPPDPHRPRRLAAGVVLLPGSARRSSD